MARKGAGLMLLDKAARAVCAAMIVTSGIAFAAPVGTPMLAALGRIEAGQWQIKPVGSDAAPRSLCVADPSVLIEYGHAGTACRHFTILDQPDTATVQYTCPGTGHGRTTIRIVTPRSFMLSTQGISAGAPFEDDFEARRTGPCAAPR